MAGTLAVIGEFNPFHNGHFYHLTKAKKMIKPDFTIAIMSGNFVQRGDTAILDKWTRAEIAIRNGFDLVIELPTIYSVSSAENFAEGAIKILHSLGFVDYLVFGSEIGEIEPINNVASVLYKEPKELSGLINRQVHSGLSYPKARELALNMYFGTSNVLTSIMSEPNNILGVEYVKAIKKYKSDITPLTFKRKNSSYHSKSISFGIASATAIRSFLNDKDKLKEVMPKSSYDILRRKMRAGEYVKDLSVFEKEIIYILRRMTISEIADLPDVTEGLENRIKSAAHSAQNLNDLISKIKSKRFTQTRIQRILVYALLNITKKDMQISQKTTPYIRILGFNEYGKRIISTIAKNNPKAKLVISFKKFVESNKDSNLNTLISKDILATNVYTLGYKKNGEANLDYTHKIVEVKDV